MAGAWREQIAYFKSGATESLHRFTDLVDKHAGKSIDFATAEALLGAASATLAII
jgi:hypothetical protein